MIGSAVSTCVIGSLNPQIAISTLVGMRRHPYQISPSLESSWVTAISRLVVQSKTLLRLRAHKPDLGGRCSAANLSLDRNLRAHKPDLGRRCSTTNFTLHPSLRAHDPDHRSSCCTAN